METYFRAYNNIPPLEYVDFQINARKETRRKIFLILAASLVANLSCAQIEDNHHNLTTILVTL